MVCLLWLGLELHVIHTAVYCDCRWGTRNRAGQWPVLSGSTTPRWTYLRGHWKMSWTSCQGHQGRNGDSNDLVRENACQGQKWVVMGNNARFSSLVKDIKRTRTFKNVFHISLLAATQEFYLWYTNVIVDFIWIAYLFIY